MNGIINLTNYLASNAFETSIKSKYFIYDKLYTFNFEEFQELQLGGYGKRSAFDKIDLLREQGLLVDYRFKGDEVNAANETDEGKTLIALYTNYRRLADEYEGYMKVTEYGKSISATDPNWEIAHEVGERMHLASYEVKAMNERVYSALIGNKIQSELFPVSTMDSYKDIIPFGQKSDIYSVVIDKIAVPDSSMPLADIIQYKNEEANQLNFLKLKTWVNKLAHSKYTLQEINEEIAFLKWEYEENMRLAGIKMKNARIEFAVKLIPELVENLVKFNWSKIGDSLFKLRSEKIALLTAERNAKGNELAYIINCSK